ncbi:hypothetical protein AK830_g2753 [Neonectria ditissima]|uniref:Uncharacterized protein n=1 Tax=Neonectria ditissima TaxID=78410 RepID=A0A0P7BQR4_9HYPO|nr:hypothetical protein AK830_g2753 [Neonectria ditissima]
MFPRSIYAICSVLAVTTPAMANSCCWGDYWAGEYWLALKWDEPAGTARCGLSGKFPEGTKCSIETSKTDDGFQQAVANLTFGVDTTPFKFRIGINADGCQLWNSDEVLTGWEGWGAYLFEGHSLTSQEMSFCDGAISA